MKSALNYFSNTQLNKEERRRMAQNNLNNSWANQRQLDNSRDQSLSSGLGQFAGTNMNVGSDNRVRQYSHLNESLSQQNGNGHGLRQSPNVSNEINNQNTQANFGQEINQRAARGMHLPHLQVPIPIAGTYPFRTSLNSLSISQAQAGNSPLLPVPTSPGSLLPSSPQNTNVILQGYPSQSESVTITNPVQQNSMIAQVSGGGAVELNEGRRRGSQRGITGHQNRSFISQNQAQINNNSGVINSAHQNFIQIQQAPNLQSGLFQINQPVVSRHQSSPIEAAVQINNTHQPQIHSSNVSAGNNQTSNGATRARQSPSGAERKPAKNTNQANQSPQNPFNKASHMKHSVEHTTLNSINHQPDGEIIKVDDNPFKDKFDQVSNKHNQSKRSQKKVNTSQQSSAAQDHHEVYSYAQFMDEIEKEDDDFRDFMQNPIPQLALDGRADGSHQYAQYSEGFNHSNSYRAQPRIPKMGQIFAETSQDLT